MGTPRCRPAASPTWRASRSAQIHYHFGSKRQLILAVPTPRMRGSSSASATCTTRRAAVVRWELACDFLDTDLASGYVRILQEMIAAGWSDPDVAASVRGMMSGWFVLLSDVARREQERGTDLDRSRPRRWAL